MFSTKASILKSTQNFIATRNLSQGGVSNFFGKILSNLGGNKTTIGSALSILHNCTFQVNKDHWYDYGMVPRNFRAKHSLSLMHIWMIHRRLHIEGKNGFHTQEALFDEFWEDTSNRIRGEGIEEISVNKYLADTQKFSFHLLAELDDALALLEQQPTPELLTEKLPDGELKVYASLEQKVESLVTRSITRSIYNDDPSIPAEFPRSIAKYFGRELDSLFSVPSLAVLEGRIKWGPMPAFGRKPGEGVTTHPKGEWRPAVSADGRTYYWNTLTRESRWEKPK